MRERAFASLAVRINEQMAEVVSGIDLDSYRDMRWIAMADRTGWAGDLELIIRQGWVRRPSGALVLKWKAAGRIREDDCHDLGDYERRVNHFYVPDDAVDPASDEAMAVLAGRGYALVRNLLTRVGTEIEHGELVGVVSVSRQSDGKPTGHIQLHEQRDGDVLVGMDDLDKYREEAVMALVAAADFAEPWVPLPPMLPGVAAAVPDEEERQRLAELAERAAACLRTAGLPIGDGVHSGAKIEVRGTGVYLTWAASPEWESQVDARYGAGDVMHPDAERRWRVDEAMSDAFVSILGAFGLRGVRGQPDRPLDVEVRDPDEETP